jgi:RNA-directed DNA polymerase
VPNPSLVTALARAFIAGEPAVDEIVERATQTLGRRWRWLNPVARRFVDQFGQGVRPRQSDVVEFLLGNPSFKSAWIRHSGELMVADWLTGPQRMQPVSAAQNWPIPLIESVGAMANWLHCTVGELEWFADLKGVTAKRCDPRLCHYHYRLLSKKSGTLRLIESPKPRLKQMQRQILEGILNQVPAHPAAHGFIKGRSIKTFAAPHTGRGVVLRMDLQDFFPSLAARRIQALFRTMGYPEKVADLLAGLCTNAARFDSWRDATVDRTLLKEARELYCRPHLPQGAPTSPALANLCSYRVDCRLSGLSLSAGAIYTRYADDLAFSGDDAFARGVKRFAIHAAAILLEEGFKVNHHKTHIMRQGVRQHLAGLVTNRHLNVGRAEFDRLKATLTNCVRRGPEGQNRADHTAFRSHLEGRVGFVESINPAKGARLRKLLEQIRW